MFLAEVVELLHNTPGYEDIVTDQEEFDANQNLWTQQVERLFWERLQVPSLYLDLYFSNRKPRRLVSKFFKATICFAKTSGEPLTLAGNTLLAALMSDYPLDYVAIAVLVIRGDDFYARLLNPKLDQGRLWAMYQVTRMHIRHSWQRASFCGFSISGGFLDPDIFRLLVKVENHAFKDYKHFCEYQISLRDQVR